MLSQVKGELVGVSEAPFNVSYARLDYHPECEAAVNEQINIEYTISYVYHSLYAYFDRDNIGAHESHSSNLFYGPQLRLVEVNAALWVKLRFTLSCFDH